MAQVSHRILALSLAALLLCLATLARGQASRLFTASDGLSSSLINCILQDSRGNVWIATEEGLNRYDGVKITVYQHHPDDEHSIAHNYVRTIFEDQEGHLLVGTYCGVQLYDPATDTFSPLARLTDGTVYQNFTTAILQRPDGELWVAGNQLAQLSITDGELICDTSLNLHIPTTLVENIIEDSKAGIWIAREGDGIYRMDKDGKAWHYPASAEMPSISTLCEDQRGNIFAGSHTNGLFMYDKRGDSFTPIYIDKDRQNLPVFVIYPFGNYKLLIGTDGEGLKMYNTLTGDLGDYTFEESAIAIHNAKIHTISKDSTDNFWIGIYHKGILMLPSQRNGFQYWGHKSPTRDIVGDDCITAIFRDQAGNTFVGTDNDGLYIIDKQGNPSAHFSHTGDPQSVPAIIMSIFEDSHGNLWLGSYSGGAAWLDPRTGKCTYIEGLTAGDTGGQNVYAFAEDDWQRVWIATMGGGLFRYDLNTRELVPMSSLNPDFNDNWISCLRYSRQRQSLIVGTQYGLCSIALNEEGYPFQYGLRETIVYSILEDKKGLVWAGTAAGLQRWDATAGEVRTYTTTDGLSNNSVYAVESDNSRHLWLSTSYGLSHFDPATEKFTNYYVGDGLQSNEFSKNASCHDHDGTLWFGGVDGITFFNPSNISQKNPKWHVRVTDFYLFGQPVRKGRKSGGRDIIDCPVSEATTFRLSHSDNAFSIEFSTLELAGSQHVTYSYTINSDVWINLSPGVHEVSFSNLSPGTYLFRLKARDGISESDVKEITIHIAQPWWNTVWAWLAYLVAFLCIASYITMLARQRYRARMESQRLRHAEQLNEEKLQFFINISHEIRTPMTLIISPLLQLMEEDTDTRRQRTYRTIHRNAERILRLVNQLLDIRKIDKGQMRLQFAETDIVELIEDLYDMFTDLATKRHISFTFRHEGLPQLPLWIDTANFDKIILNILSNAFKFTPDDGSIEIALSVEEDTHEGAPFSRYAQIAITDSGIGIDPSELESIFERFYQARGNNSSLGIGVGLHLTRSLVQLHHGIIFAQNRDDGTSGSRFVVRLPIGSAHLRPDEIKPDTSAARPVSAPPREALSPLRTLSPEEEEESDSKRSSTQRRRILLVEDDEEIRVYLRQQLSHDYYVSECTNGKEALEQIFRSIPDLVISDIMMPEMDGLTLCRRIKQNIHLNHIPVILLTAKTREEDNIEGLDTGADAYVTKPFNLEVLRHTVKNLILGHEKLRTIYSGQQESASGKIEKMEAQSPDDRLMERIMKAVNANISNPSLTVEQIATEVGVSRVHLHRKLKELTNQTTRDFLRNIRMKQAATLLAEKPHAISEVAEMVGYTNLSTFSTHFKELYGVSPSAYREQHR
ncbi:MAG: response regulator [Prevotellaceae bacterium]|nr:response regulator [Prevotellaceae bacterium]